MTGHCESCHVGMPLVAAVDIEKKLNELPGWLFNAEKQCLEKTYQFKGFYKTMAFVNAIAWIAHQEKHHPDMQVSYNKVVVQFQTHEAGGVTKNDLICAKFVENLDL